MLDLEYVIKNLNTVIIKLKTRGGDFAYLKDLTKLDKKRKDLIKESDNLKQERNQKSKLIGVLKREKKDPKSILKEISGIGSKIAKLDKDLEGVNHKIKDILLNTPNIPASDVPCGKDDTFNKEIKKVGKPTKFTFPVKDHLDLGEQLGILDPKRAAKVSGARFTYYTGLGARLERALINFMMDHHAKKGYQEVLPPYLINEESMYATGQFPKFKEDAFKIEKKELYLNPTAEVPMINMYRNEILNAKDLTLSYCAYSAAFRQEAGSAGRDTRGIIRQHQFNKVELIKFTKPEDSEKEHLKMLNDAADILNELNLPYRIVILSTGDMGFSMQKTYDIEVWLPSQGMYREISSVSNAGDYQARRGGIRYKESPKDKANFVHTLNGSGLAVGRTFVAILENFQQKDGSVKIPEKLVPYMQGVKVIKK